MRRSLLLAVAAASTLSACSQPSVASCSKNSDCPKDAICVTGICQKGVPSGGAAATASGAGHLTAGTRTMDVVLGGPIAGHAASGTKTLDPATNTR